MDSSLVYLRELSGTLFRYHQENFLCDVVIVTAEQSEVRAHSVVLASVSSKLRAAFEQSNTANVKKNYPFRLRLAECEASVLEILLQYIYTGTITLYSQLTMEIINNVIQASQKLGLDMTIIEACIGVMLQFAGITSEGIRDWRETVEDEDVFMELDESGEERSGGLGKHQDEVDASTSRSEVGQSNVSSDLPERGVEGKWLDHEARIANLEAELIVLRDFLSQGQNDMKPSDEEDVDCEGRQKKKRKIVFGAEETSSTEDDVWLLLSDLETLMKLCKSKSRMWSLLTLTINTGIILYKKTDEDCACMKQVLQAYSSYQKDASSLNTSKKVEDFMNYGFARSPVIFTIDNIENASAVARRGLCEAIDNIHKKKSPSIVLATTGDIHQLDPEFLTKFSIFYCSI